MFVSFRKFAHLSKILLFLTLTTTFGFGCKGLSAQDQAAIRPVTLNYWTVYNNADQLRKLAAQYQQLRPYVTVNIRQVRYDEFDKLLTNALADDVQPDIISVHTRWLKRYVNRLSPMPASVKMGRLVQTNSVTKDTQVVFDTNPLPSLDDIKRNYIATVATDVVNGGKVYGLPLAFDTLAIYYNKDLLDKAGLPESPKTWDEFLEAVKRTTKLDKDNKIAQSGAALGTGATIDNSFDILSLFMMQNGVKMSTPNGAVTFTAGLGQATTGAHPAIQALNFYTDFARPTKESYSWNDDMGKAFDAFVRGKVTFYFGYAFDRSRILSRAPEMNLEVIPVPQLNPGAPSNIANYWLETVVKKSKHKDEAWDFIRFMATVEKVKTYTTATNLPSPFRVHIKEQSTDPFLGPFASQALIAQNWYRGKDIDITEKAFKDLITDALVPPGPTEDPVARQSSLLGRAAQVINQTL